MIDLNDLAFQNADVLIAIEEAPLGQWSLTALGKHLGRDKSNLGKTLRRLTEEGILADPPLSGLTGRGQAQLAAIQRARHGGDKRRVRGRAPFDRFVPNPANRSVRNEAVRAAADTIEAVGDVVQPVEVTPPDANGVRMFLDGEHRWRACMLLESEGRLPDALKDGLKFEEREATDAEQILIRIVTATARADLSPLDDARQLLALQEATGWSAREIAKKTGRSPADSDTGVRDVQVKIKVAKEATDFFLKQYELDGSWDRLRDSVTQPKPRLSPEAELSEALAEHGTAALGASATTSEPPAAGEAPPPHIGESVRALPWIAAPIMALHVKRDRVAYQPFSHPDGSWFVSLDVQIGAGGFSEPNIVSASLPVHDSQLAALKHARRRVMERFPDLSSEIRDWLDKQLGPHFVNGVDRLNASNAGEARRALGWDKRPSNSGGGSAKASAATADPTPAATPLPIEPGYGFAAVEDSDWYRANDVQIRAKLDLVEEKPAKLLLLVEAADAACRRPFGDGAHRKRAEIADLHDGKTMSQHQVFLDNSMGGFEYRGGHPALVSINCWAWTWLGDKGWLASGGACVDPARLRALRVAALGEAKAAALDASGRYATEWLNVADAAAQDEAVPTPATPAQPTSAPLSDRADRMGQAADAGTALVLAAAIGEIIEAADCHMANLRAILEDAGQDLSDFDADAYNLRAAITLATDAVDGLGLGEGAGLDPLEPFSRRLTPDAPFVPVRKSITPEHVTCLEDGRRFAGGLRRHLLSRYNLTPSQYREKWSLPADYPMVAPNYAKRQHDALRAAALKAGTGR